MEKLGNQHATNIDNLVTNNQLDGKEEAGGLSMEEIGEREGLLKDFWKLLRIHESILCQKSILKWLVEKAENAKFFHGVVN